LFTDLAHAPKEHVLNEGGIRTDAREKGVDDRRPQVNRMNASEAAAAPTACCSSRSHNVGFIHFDSPRT